jgi:hypothetical protein
MFSRSLAFTRNLELSTRNFLRRQQAKSAQLPLLPLTTLPPIPLNCGAKRAVAAFVALPSILVTMWRQQQQQSATIVATNLANDKFEKKSLILSCNFCNTCIT